MINKERMKEGKKGRKQARMNEERMDKKKEEKERKEETKKEIETFNRSVRLNHDKIQTYTCRQLTSVLVKI